MIGEQGTPYGEQYPQQPPQGWPGSAGGFGSYPEPGAAPGGHGPAGPGQGPWGYPPQPPPPRKSSVGLIIAVVVGALVALGLFGTAAVFALSSAGSSAKRAVTPPSSQLPSAQAATPTPSEIAHTINLPDSAGGYTRTTGNVTDRLISSMRQAMSKDAASGAALRNAKIAVYAKGDQRIIFFGLSISDSPAFADELKRGGPSAEVDSVFIGGGIAHTDDYPVGPLGGVLRCGQKTAGNLQMSLCTWGDSSTVGAVFGPTMVPRRLATAALDFRAATER